MAAKEYKLFFTLTLVGFVLFTSCETGHNKSVTGDYFDRSPGELAGITAGFDSLTEFLESTGEFSSMFAGTYKNTTAFSVIKFPIPAKDLIDSLETATLMLTVTNTWRDGVADYDLFETVSDWSDSVRLDPDMFMPAGSPVSTYSDTASSITSMEFRLSGDMIKSMRSWSNPGAFMVRGSETCETMVNLTSWYSNTRPRIEYVYRKAVGELDTTSTDCLLTNYSFDTGFDLASSGSKFTSIVADADVRGFKIKLPLPDSLPSTAAINKCVLTITVNELLIPSGDTFYIGLYQLTAPASSFVDASYESTNSIEKQIEDGVESFDIDITDFINAWHAGNKANYGILVKPLRTGDSPSYIVCSLQDSLSILYSTLPEVE